MDLSSRVSWFARSALVFLAGLVLAASACLVSRAAGRAPLAPAVLPGVMPALSPAWTSPVSPTRELPAGPRSPHAISTENAGRLVQVGRLGPGRIEQVVYSPDGRLLALAAAAGLYVYDLRTQAQVLAVPTPVGPWYASVAFSPDGETLAAGSRDGSVHLVALAGGRRLRTLPALAGEMLCVAFSPDGRIVAAGAGNGTVRLWQADDGRLLRTLDGRRGSVLALTFSPDGARLAWGTKDGAVQIWHVDGSQPMQTLAGSPSHAEAVAFLPLPGREEPVLAAGFRDGNVRLWTHDLLPLLTFPEDGAGQVFGLAAGIVPTAAGTPEAIVAAGRNDGTVRMWRAGNWEPVLTLQAHEERVQTLALAPDGRTMATGSRIGDLKVWDTRDGRLLARLGEYPGQVAALAFSPDRSLLAVLDRQARVRLFDLAAPAGHRLIRILEAPATGEPLPASVEPTSALAFSPNGATLAAPAGSTVYLWRVADGSVQQALPGHGRPVSSLAFQADGRTLAVAAGRIFLWDITGRASLLRELEQPQTLSYSVASVAGGEAQDALLAAGLQWDGTWDVAHVDSWPGRPVSLRAGATGASYPLATGLGSDLFAAATDVVRVWRLADGRLLWQSETGWPRSLAFDPTDRLLAAGPQTSVWLWRARDGALLNVLEHGEVVEAVAFRPDGAVLASGSRDGIVRLWGVPPH